MTQSPNYRRRQHGAADGLASLLLQRRSVREYAGGALTLGEVGRLCWAGQGISHGSGKRTVPSAHGLNPLSLRVVAGEVEGVESGVYDYEPSVHALDAVGSGDRRGDLYRAALEDQPWVQSCAALIVISGDLRRAESEFAHQPPRGKRGRRYVYMEAGAAAQNIALQAAGLGLGTVVVGGFDDQAVRRCLAIRTQPLVVIPVGRTSV